MCIVNRTPRPSRGQLGDNADVPSVMFASVTKEPLDEAELASKVMSAAAGAIITFSGTVRDHDHGRQVLRLEYEAHPTAGVILNEVAQEISGRFPDVSIAVAHRVGPLEIGDSALVAVTASPHRAEAFAACSSLVDLVKERLPVWKHQYFVDGTDEWVNCA